MQKECVDSFLTDELPSPACYGEFVKVESPDYCKKAPGACGVSAACREKYRVSEVKNNTPRAAEETAPAYSKLDADFCRQWLSTLQHMAESRRDSGDESAFTFLLRGKPLGAEHTADTPES
jgi:hypothetical protein